MLNYNDDDVRRDYKLINDWLKKHFDPKSQTQYRLIVVNQSLERQFNFFFETYPKEGRQKSVAICEIKIYDLKYLEQVINGLSTKLTRNAS